jgi:hypothetical protein
MTDEPVEGNLEQSDGEQAAAVKQPAASQKEGQPLPDYVTAILSRLDALDKQVKGVQKGTDKQIKHEVTSSIDRILELAGSGKSKNEIERELWIDQMMQGQGASDRPAASDKSSTTSGFDMAVIDEVFGLPANDSRVTDLKVRYANDPKAYMAESLKLAAQLADQREATPAEQPIIQGGVHRQSDNPIENINDSRTLYRLAAQQMAKQSGRKRGAS